MRILLVEDEASLADVLERGLKAHGHEVGRAASAEAAVMSILEQLPDSIVLDIGLPDLSGWEVLRRLSPVDRERLHVVVISAAPISQRRIDEFKPAHALLKPFPITALVRAIEDSRAPVEAVGSGEGDYHS
jgi:two-component system KDP operon response regulator KdpE